MSDRGKCCKGDPSCALNKIVKKVDTIFAVYDNDKIRAKELLDNHFLELEEENEMKAFRIEQLVKQVHQLNSKDMP